MSKKSNILGWVFAIAAIGLPLSVHSETATPPKPAMVHLQTETARLIDLLIEGGNVMFIRHERTDASVPDAMGLDPENCASQRNLSIAGIANASENGTSIQNLDIPITSVQSSPLCRTQETARLLFGSYEVNAQLAGPFAGEMDMMQMGENVRALIAAQVDADGNTVLVSHLGVFRAAFGGHLGEGDIAVIRQSNGEIEVSGIIPANGWNDAEIDATLGTRAEY